jgi:RecB family exonuclease
MHLPENFSFSQQNLEDFINCRRLFQLRYIQKQEWPSLESEPVREHEALMRLGEQFHALVYQQGIGIPGEQLSYSISDPILAGWWQSFLVSEIDRIEGDRQFEKTLSIPFEGYRLLAKYDLVIHTPDGRALIYDWKTSQHEPRRKWLQDRMQTKVYPFVMAMKTDPPLINAANISMTYWYPVYPGSAVQFDYSTENLNSDHDLISGLIHEIEALSPDEFYCTEKEKLCEFCRYRSLCDRGIKAGDVHHREETDVTDASAFDIDFSELSD